MKTCTRCGTAKPISDFQIRKASPDGLTASCKACLRVYDKSRAMLPHRVAQRTEYQKSPNGKPVVTAVKKRWAARNKEKRKAHSLLWNAILSGTITKQPCKVCGSAKRTEAHHPDYDQPLDVVWLCSAHHKQVHAMAKA